MEQKQSVDQIENDLSNADLIDKTDASSISDTLENSIIRLKLVQIFRSGDIKQLENFIQEHPDVAKNRQFLLRAVQIAPTSVISWIISTYVPENKIDINATDNAGNTPLHLAAIYGRQDVALELLASPQINDTIQNLEGKQPVEVSRYPELAESMQIARAQYVEQAAVNLRKYLDEENYDALDDLLSSPRATALLDLNGQDPDSGTTVLHEYVKDKNYKMVEFLLGHGVDPFRRDIKGVLPLEIAKGDERMRKILKNSMKEQTIFIQNHSENSAAGTNVEGGRPSIDTVGYSQKPLNVAPNMKGYLKKWTNITGGYKLRWFVLENGVLSYYKRQTDTENACRGSINLKQAQVHLDSSEKLRFEVSGKGGAKFHLKGNHPVETNRWVWNLSNAIQHAKDVDRIRQHFDLSQSSLPRSRASSISSRILSKMNKKRASDIERESFSSHKSERGNEQADNEQAINDSDEGESADNYEDDEEISLVHMKHQNERYGLEDSICVGFSAVGEVLVKLKGEQATMTTDKAFNGLEAIRQGLNGLSESFDQYKDLVSRAENQLKRQLEQAKTKEFLWAKNLESLQVEHDQIQEQLHRALAKRKEVYKMLKKEASKDVDNDGNDQTLSNRVVKVLSEDESDDEDEFFDAENEEQVMNDRENEEDKSFMNELTDTQSTKEHLIVEQGTFDGYEDEPRKKLDLSQDDRPKISLWGILKNLIGKDMTRMTLPVTFNECTSLLQRYCEDFEYPYLLDNAAKEVDDPALRSVWVAAFALSSYSSTLNRVAKPFNPLLGETFEYARPDKQYRLFCEQVSHHPPIGAMYGEHPKWDYYGHSFVSPKFNGRAIDVVPGGRWYLRLRPDKGAQVEEELYSFRKLTSTVVGIITGSPEVDNHGTLEVINHTLGYKCIVKCKKQGWRGGGAYEVRGYAKAPDGKDLWVIGGHWNTRLMAKKLDETEKGDEEMENMVKDTEHKAGERILLWQVKHREPSPFNLTQFAISLNALPEHLKTWLAPTDTRFRPDQRAMELGQYDLAFKEKDRVEKKQRAARKTREINGEEWKPEWFTEEIHPITKEEYYRPSEKYWQRRKQRELADVGDIF